MSLLCPHKTVQPILLHNAGPLPSACKFAAGELYPTQVRTTAHGMSAGIAKVGALWASVWFNYLGTRQKFWITACVLSPTATLVSTDNCFCNALKCQADTMLADSEGCVRARRNTQHLDK